MQNKLIISPHVDDEVLGCGGVLDSTFSILHLGLSESQNHGNSVLTKQERLLEFQKVISHLSIKWHKLLDHPVNNYKQQDLIGDLEKTINELKPSEIYIPHPSYNQDHRACYEACLIALRPHDIHHFTPKVLIYEQPQVYLWNNNYREFKPNYFKQIDIDKKILLYSMLESQVREFRSPECIKSMAKVRGSQIRAEYAEAFEILRIVD